MPDERVKREVPPAPVLRRRGNRPGAGADTPSGPDTDRSAKPAKREQAEQEPDRRDEPRFPKAGSDA